MTAPAAPPPSLETLKGRARSLVPMLRDQASATEANRSVIPETVAALHDAGLTRICQPARFGGYELSWDAPVDLGRILAAACPSTAWLVSIVGPHSAYIGRFPLEAQEEVWADGKGAIMAGPRCRAAAPFGATAMGCASRGSSALPAASTTRLGAS